jgi:CheY-like chemotaxis protein
LRERSIGIASSRRACDGLIEGVLTDPLEGGASSGTPARSEGKSLSGLRILVVEDDVDSLELVSAVLADAGAVVECAASVAEGFGAFSRSNPDLLVSDIAMPEEDGYSLMRRIRVLCAAEGGLVPAIALSAFTRPEDVVKALAAGFSLHVGKPVFPVDLIHAAGRLMAALRKSA